VPSSQQWLLESLQPRPCDFAPTTVDTLDWTMADTDPLFPSIPGHIDVDVAVSGQADQVARASLLPRGGTGTCSSQAPEGSLSFDGETLTINAQWPNAGEICELHFQGRVPD